MATGHRGETASINSKLTPKKTSNETNDVNSKPKASDPVTRIHENEQAINRLYQHGAQKREKIREQQELKKEIEANNPDHTYKPAINKSAKKSEAPAHSRLHENAKEKEEKRKRLLEEKNSKPAGTFAPVLPTKVKPVKGAPTGEKKKPVEVPASKKKLEEILSKSKKTLNAPNTTQQDTPSQTENQNHEHQAHQHHEHEEHEHHEHEEQEHHEHEEQEEHEHHEHEEHEEHEHHEHEEHEEHEHHEHEEQEEHEHHEHEEHEYHEQEDHEHEHHEHEDHEHEDHEHEHHEHEDHEHEEHEHLEFEEQEEHEHHEQEEHEHLELIDGAENLVLDETH